MAYSRGARGAQLARLLGVIGGWWACATVLNSCGASSSGNEVRQCRTDAECGEGLCSTNSTCIERPTETAVADSGAATPVDSNQGDGGPDIVSGEASVAASVTSMVNDSTGAVVSAGASTDAVTGESDVTSTTDQTSGPITPEEFDAEIGRTCTASCDESQFVIPVALCEDFSLRVDSEGTHTKFEFCDTPAADTCADGCEQAFDASREACQQALLPAVACVDRQGYYDDVGLLAEGCIFNLCMAELLSMAAQCNSRSAIESAHEKWTGTNLTAYRFKLGDNQVEVINGEANWVPSAGTLPAPTIDELFDRITSFVSGTATFAEFDAELGFPTLLLEYRVGLNGCAEATETPITEFTQIEP